LAAIHFRTFGLFSKNLKITIPKSIIFPVDLYGCETWPLTLREEYRLGVFENKVVKRIFGPKSDVVPGAWRKVPKEDVRDLYSSIIVTCYYATAS
jgi:hypothetical protein